jgi:hypothetical protein
VDLMANMLVEIDAGALHVARCESYGMARHFAGVAGGVRQRVSSDGVPAWRFSRRVATTEWIRMFGEDEYSPISYTF